MCNRLFMQPDTGNLYLCDANGGRTPSIVFQRGSLSDNTYDDFQIYDTEGDLHFDIHRSSWSTVFYINGNGIVCNAGVTALSDARHKNIIRDTMLSVEQIAQMPSVVYRWNDGREDDGLHVGSIAQNWQSVLPEVVLTANDEEHTLSMQYGVAALVSSITIARKVVNHEQRIKELEKECERLRTELEQVKAA